MPREGRHRTLDDESVTARNRDGSTALRSRTVSLLPHSWDSLRWCDLVSGSSLGVRLGVALPVGGCILLGVALQIQQDAGCEEREEADERGDVRPADGRPGEQQDADPDQRVRAEPAVVARTQWTGATATTPSE